MSTNFKVGDLVFHRSDTKRENPMVIVSVQFLEPESWQNPITGEMNFQKFEPHHVFQCEWFNSQRIVKTHTFKETDLQEITD